MKPSIILYKTLPDDLLHRLEAHFTVTQVPNLHPETVARHAQAFASAQGLLGASETVNRALLEKMPALRAASTISVGYDNVEVDALTARKIVLMHTPAVLTETVADTVMALMLATARRVVDVAERVKAHFGFTMPVLYHARRRHQEAEDRFNARYCDLDTLLQEADFVCVILPLTAETRHLFGATQFARMKSSAIFINAGRGPVVDENALIAALQNGEIYAAGLDVFEQEPLSVDSPLLNMSNVVAVPHIGSATHETRYNMMACAVDNLIDALQGKIEKNCVNPQAAG
ncbi:NAD(P)-dependent oxidoreductase [Salmonella enterica]|uniref:NAD(P)-dependent oxidoreductase n=1 Tax=Salmonella enterica TaxID=28901 RepID=UPI000BB616C2|nr:NAD(P)-dependent oxidoreductase [Salmonella enterica]PBO36742.1 bifunctional glyoxylate/hydroxypyruvate reductase B [Salmonella enterica subsp. enterica serovar Enteritidis]